MKWMVSSVGALMAILSVSVAAQSGGTPAMGKMDKMKDATYTGCVEAGGMPGSFMLTHLAADNHMSKESMKKDAMKDDTMKEDAMGKDGGMKHDAMAPTAWSLASSSVDLSKHVGHKVKVTGSAAPDKMDGMGKSAPAFTVTALKMVAASCS